MTSPPRAPHHRWIGLGWIAAVAVAGGVRLWNALRGPLLRGFDDHGHVGYVLYLDLYGAVPWADQGWSYFHPPLHYLLGWALAGAGDAEVLLRGLAAWNGLASLGVAALAAAVVRRTHPGRPGLPLLAFAAVALLPVYLYTSGMAGNELTATLLATAGFAVFLANEGRPLPAPRGDVAAGLSGLLLGLGLLAKASAVLFLAAAAGWLALRGLRERTAWRRGAVLAGVALALASPYYARNVVEFGTPLRMSRDTQHVAALESRQPPGERHLLDYLRVPAALLVDPRPEAQAMLGSVWGTAYAYTWADVRSEWDVIFPGNPRVRITRRLLVALGLLPTGLALAGALLAARDLRRGRRVWVYGPLALLALFGLAAFAVFAWRVPHFSALKASYLLGLTLPFAAALARAVEGLAGRPALRGAAAAGTAAAALVAAAVNTHGLLLPRMPSHEALGTVRFALGDLDAAREAFERQRRRPVMRELWGASWSDNLASVALLEGDARHAATLFGSHRPARNGDALRWNAYGVATALAGPRPRARSLLDRAVATGGGEVALANRGAVRASLGDLVGARRDLRAALERDPHLAPAWQALAEVEARAGRARAEHAARRRAAEAARRAPRGHPYGIPDGLGQRPSWNVDLRWMLWLEDEGLRLARAPFRPEDALAAGDPRAPRPAGPHLALLVIDTLRADHLGAYGYPRPTSPHIDGLARRGVRFARAFAPSSWTLPSMASLFTSRLPVEHGARVWGEPIDPRLPRLAERLREAGYWTLGVSGNFVHVTEEAGFDRGFDDWSTLSGATPPDAPDALFQMELGGGTLGVRAPTAQEVNARVLARLPAPEQGPVFVYAHYMEPHSGYDPPPPWREAFARDPRAHAAGSPATTAHITALAAGARRADAAERARLVDLYDAEIAAVDAAVGRLLAALEERGFGDDLVVVVVADHGEAFGEHGSWFHGTDLHRSGLQVPFIVWDARSPAGGRVVEQPVDLLDVPATLLDLAGLPPLDGWRGRPLLAGRPPPRRHLAAFLAPDPRFEEAVAPRAQRRALLRWPWKLIVDADGAARVYHLGRDPGEARPLAVDGAGAPAWAGRVASRLALDVRRAERRRDGVRAPSEEAIRALRALGYAR